MRFHDVTTALWLMSIVFTNIDGFAVRNNKGSERVISLFTETSIAANIWIDGNPIPHFRYLKVAKYSAQVLNEQHYVKVISMNISFLC